MTLWIDVFHAKTVDKTAGGVQNAMRDLPIKIDHGAIQRCNVDLIPCLWPMKRLIKWQELCNAMWLWGDAAMTNYIDRVHVELRERAQNSK